jgi:hypothetical protein
MLLARPIKFRKPRRTVKASAGAPAPVGPLVLVSAAYDEVGFVLTLGFDRAVSLAGLDGSAIVVNDAAETGALWDATGGATLLDPVTAELQLVAVGGASGAGITLNASAANGIVAVGDAAAWAGVTDLQLPFP